MRTVRIGVVQPNQRVDVVHDVRARIDHLAALQQATADLEVRGAELVVWSEAAYWLRALPRSRPRTSPRAIAAASATASPCRHGGGDHRARGLAPPWNSAILLERDGALRRPPRQGSPHDRQRVQPAHRVVRRRPRRGDAGRRRQQSPAAAAAVALETSIDGIRLRLAVAVCLEDVLPAFGRDLAAPRSDLVVNVTNDTWFGGAEPLQHEALARFRPVVCGVPLVRAVNGRPVVGDRSRRRLPGADRRARGR
ncbi:MAG: hypothetical protein HS111_30635 [Kofleriaceae bacterium]|nr:hypothetical protein [Kofleriaceae bacterium]